MGRKFSEFNLVTTPSGAQFALGYDPDGLGIRIPHSSLVTWLNSVIGTSFGRSVLNATTVAGQRTALGLGDAATKSVGTSAGTVAAGDHGHATLTLTCSDDSTTHVLSVKKLGSEYVLKLD